MLYFFTGKEDKLEMFSAQKLDIKATELKAGLLLSEPLHDEGPKEEENIERAVCSYSNESERFLLKDRSFSRQYAQIYSVRIMAMRKKLATAARRKWGLLSIYFNKNLACSYVL